MDPSIARHCAELNRCNQRGGRMLSVLDLLDADTLGLDLAAYLMARISRGASFLVGAVPGGAGKTTVMCALLNLLPKDVVLEAATAEAVRRAGHAEEAGKRCYVCHEIGSGPYFAYLWDRDLRDYCALADKGHVLATNLHADDLDEAHAQICVQNRAPEAHFRHFALMLFLHVGGGYTRRSRRVETVYAAEGAGPHRLVYDAGRGVQPSLESAWERRCRDFLEEEFRSGRREIEAVRGRVLAFME